MLKVCRNIAPKNHYKFSQKIIILIQEFGEERRDFIAIENVPQKMINAILAIEDRRFFEHPGIDFIGIIRAAVKNFTGQSREGCEYNHNASCSKFLFVL